MGSLFLGLSVAIILDLAILFLLFTMGINVSILGALLIGIACGVFGQLVTK